MTLILAARFMQSMRSRDVPLEVLAPTVAPGGFDTSAVKILVWLGDGFILTCIGALTLVVLPWGAPVLAVLLGVLILVGLLVGWTRSGHRPFLRA